MKVNTWSKPIRWNSNTGFQFRRLSKVSVCVHTLRRTEKENLQNNRVEIRNFIHVFMDYLPGFLVKRLNP